MSEKALHVTLLRHTLGPEELISLGARLCYAKASIDDLTKRVSGTDQAAFINHLLEMGHDSVLEHASFTFGIEGVSRSLLAQITRHRIASFSVQSQRYVSYKQGFGYIVPQGIKALGEEAVETFKAQMAQIQAWYEGWQEKLGEGEASNEDARFVLPNAAETRLMVTMNVRELNHFFALRMCNRAQWEIRHLAAEMHARCLDIAPALFRLSGPGCLRGACPEGNKACGRRNEIKNERQALLNRIEERE